jgi:predicted nucleic acid-binding protein
VILLDTSVVSAALRRRKRGEREETVATRLGELLAGDDVVALPGIVFQELLSGVAQPGQQERLLKAIRQSFPLVLATEGDHLKAADLVTHAARRGRALSTPDALIAAQAINRRAALFTTDADFEALAGDSSLRLVSVSP